MSRNYCPPVLRRISLVTSREGRVSRNLPYGTHRPAPEVTSREGRVSRNYGNLAGL